MEAYLITIPRTLYFRPVGVDVHPFGLAARIKDGVIAI